MSLKAVENLNLRKSTAREDSSDGNVSFEDEEMEKEVILDSVLANATTTTGKDIFSFQKKKKHEILESKIEDDSSEQSDDSTLKKNPKTPHKIRNKLKKGIAYHAKEFSSDDDEADPFSGSESEYSPSDKSEDEENSESNSEESEEEEESGSESNSEKGSPKKKHQAKVEPTIFKRVRGQPPKNTNLRQNQKEYLINTEEYFANKSSKKTKTSNHSLDKLKTPRLSQDQLQKLLTNMKISKQHQSALFNASQNVRANFNKWMYILHENFNILLYGLGSKRTVLQDFHKEFLSDLPVMVINGFFPSLTLKEILDGIIDDILELKENPANNYEACDLIAQEFEKIPDTHLYLIVHNIEGDMLRNQKSQNILAKLASVRNVHFIASIDHINAPLLWNHYNLSKFNFTWWDVTSFMPYTDETSFESSMMIQRTGNLALSSLRNVFLSLTTNSKGIYLIIVKHQLEHGDDQYYQGMLFKDLYWACKQAFLVSSDLALRAQLTEFVDHKMVKFRRSLDGAEHLIIPIASNLLQQFLSEQQK